eukprot:GHVT01048319.1.p1 GENE.GHVT01048319.1~~GHVT01048319.1.p1  ORF type:complete len:106 (+),score=10.11 GHVT01048319.1:2564-2881(+)
MPLGVAGGASLGRVQNIVVPRAVEQMHLGLAIGREMMLDNCRDAQRDSDGTNTRHRRLWQTLMASWIEMAKQIASAEKQYLVTSQKLSRQGRRASYRNTHRECSG